MSGWAGDARSCSLVLADAPARFTSPRCFSSVDCWDKDALNAFAHAADIDPELTEAWYNKGMALIELGKYLEAIRVFDKVLNIHPYDDRARE